MVCDHKERAPRYFKWKSIYDMIYLPSKYINLHITQETVLVLCSSDINKFQLPWFSYIILVPQNTLQIHLPQYISYEPLDKVQISPLPLQSTNHYINNRCLLITSDQSPSWRLATAFVIQFIQTSKYAVVLPLSPATNPCNVTKMDN